MSKSISLLNKLAISVIATLLILAWAQHDVEPAYAQPANDDFANTVLISSLPFTTTQTTTGATVEAGEPLPCGAKGSTVWFSFTPAADAQIIVDTVGSPYDTVLAAYTGSAVNALTTVACNDDFLGLQSQIIFSATAGVTYHIQAGGYIGLTGSLTLNVDSVLPPVNDDFSNAVLIPGLPFTTTQSTIGATVEAGEPLPCGLKGSTVWFSVTPPADSQIIVDTAGSLYDTVVAAYTGSAVNALTTVACNDNGGPGLTSRIDFAATAGTTYQIQGGGFAGDAGSLTLNVNAVPPPAPIPPGKGPFLGTDASGDHLLSINTVTGVGTIVGGKFVGAVPSLAVDRATGVIYAGGGGGNPSIYTVDKATGLATLLGDSGLGLAAIGGLDVDSAGTLYAAVNIAGAGGTGSDHLATISKITGAATIIGPFGTCTGVTVPSSGGGACTIEGIEGIAFDASGTLWGAHSARGAAGAAGLYTINPTTGAATFVAPIDDGSGAPSGGVVSLQFDCNGTLYGGSARAISPANDGGFLGTINTGSGLWTFFGTVSATGGSSLGALAFQDPCAAEGQININVVDKLSGGKLEGTCWRISYGPAKISHDVVGDDSGGVKPDCGEPSNLKLFDKDPSPGNLRITITSAQRVQFGDIWHAQMSFEPNGNLDTFNYECDLSLGKCEIGPVAVGGLVVDLDQGPLLAAQSSGPDTGRLAGAIASIAALAVTLTGAAWFARRRWVN